MWPSTRRRRRRTKKRRSRAQSRANRTVRSRRRPRSSNRARREASLSNAPVDYVGAPLEGACEFAERGVEHRAHQRAEHPALELVVDEKAHARALPFSVILEGPDVFEPAEQPVDIFERHVQTPLVAGA